MKSNIFKKAIIITYLAIFLFGLFVPFSQTFAQTNKLILTADRYTIEKSTTQENKYTQIMAKIDDFTIHQNPTGYATINFSAEPSVEKFNGRANCIANLNNSWSCYANFGSSSSGEYIISATTINNIKSNTIKVTVCGTREIVQNNVCVDPLKGIPIVSLSASPTKINLNEQTTITATIEKTKGGQIISFGTTGTTYQVSSKTCTIPKTDKEQTSFCKIIFRSPIDSGTFRISALVYENQADFNKPKPDPFNIVPFVDVLVEDPSFVIKDGKTNTTINTDTTYQPLAPLPGLGTDGCKDKDGNPITDPKTGKIIPCIDTAPSDTNKCPFGNYLNIMIKIIIGFAAVLAMVMIVVGGIEYMTSDLVSSKEAGKETITHAILGLLLALGAFLILNTINPKLLSACLDKLPQATITILPFDDTNSYVVKTSGSCKIITTGDCSPTNFKSLNIFTGKEEKASMVCSIESGGKADTKSFSDYCSEGKTTFSFGLFQINLLVHGDKIPSSVGNCKDLFVTTKGEDIGYGKKGYVVKDEKGNYSYDCKLKPDRGSDYARCSAYLKTASGNLNIASVLFKSRGLGDWKASDQKVCPAAFQ